MNLSTSISDYPSYRNVCKLAAENDEIFKSFKKQQRYNIILEHLSDIDGIEYLKYIKPYFTPGQLSKFNINDHFGDPRTYEYQEYGIWSPTTLYYIKVLCDIFQYYGRIDQIIEIGGGYGGQCLIIKEQFPEIEYHIFDLPEPLLLTQKYLEKVSIKAYLHNTLESKDLDIKDNSLVLSNWAFSEINRDIQDEYIKCIISKVNHGYMLYNHSTNSYTVEEMNRKIPNSKIEEPKPNFGWINNKLLWW